ncbi:MAG: sulfide/dihydroorotate dehydrogenase-like FAD/NAD-binding protein [Clostridia bacterium]|nr:sulfide/dihydroorotate dehydrogenase-like FAD/NAD-binding protein [Clostridia bacterium]
MNKILSIRKLAPNVKEYVIEAPLVAKRCKPGQFVIVIVDEDGERVPFTIADYDRTLGTITILVQEVGYSTMRLGELTVGDSVYAFVGPLGNPTDLEQYDKVVLVGGGIGTAVIYPQAKRLKSIQKSADVIVGARTKELVMYEEEFLKNAENLYIVTDDGSYKEKGFVTDKLKALLDSGKKYDAVFAVGPMPMMRAVANLTREYGIKTIVSMNSIMVDGTGMCGGCRLTVGGETKYACVDGPEFDGHLVNFDEAMNRLTYYKEIEADHKCRLRG